MTCHKTVGLVVGRNRTLGGAAASKGFNLIEMAIALVIIGILAGVGTPNFKLWLENLRLQDSVGTLHASLLRARSEAQRLNGLINLCKTGNIYAADPDCNANITGTSTPVADKNWSYGWLIYTTTATGAAYDPLLGHELLAAVDPETGDKNITIASNADVATYLTFGGDGRIVSGSPTFVLCINGDNGKRGYRIEFGATGRPISENFKDLTPSESVCTL